MDSEDIQTMEQIRQRLVALAGNIRHALAQFHQSEAVPSWNQIHAVQKSISAHLRQMQKILGDDEKSKFLHAAHAFPTSTFPFHQENIVGNLLRKRLEPDVSSWADRARIKGALLEREGAGNMPLRDWVTLWDWAAPEANEVIRQVLLKEPEDEDEDDEDEDETVNKMDVDTRAPALRSVDGPSMPLHQLLTFGVSAGAIAPRIERAPGTRPKGPGH